MIGYKAVKKDEKGYYTDGHGNAPKHYWKLNQVYEVEGELSLCSNGYHFFRHLCYAIDFLEKGNHIFECEILGDIKEDTFKCVTNKIRLKRHISKKEIKEAVDGRSNTGRYNGGDYNSGSYNIGHHNSGNYNSGDHNSGHHNSGRRNSGNCNSGHYNSGDHNSGNYNTGYHNSGDGNSGCGNSGGYNSGNFNSGYCNSGSFNSGDGYLNYFCTKKRYFLFDEEVKKIPEELRWIDMSWFDLDGKTYKEAWAECPQKIRDELAAIPAIRAHKSKFTEITGLRLNW